MQLGTSLSLTHAGVAIWTPRRLFAAGEQGAWYDPSDLSTLFQDSAGTTPVTAVGQPVGLMKDKSGRGNHASQSTTTARPTLQQDSGGRYYLSFDGVDDRLAAAAGMGAFPQFISAALRYSTAASTKYGIGSYNSGAGMSLYSPSDNTLRTIAATATATVAPSGGTNTGANIVQSGQSDGVGATSFVNQGAGSSSAQIATVAGDGSFSIGSLRGGGSYAAIRLYGGVVISRIPTSVERATLIRYLAGKSGVTL